ncbi:MULTISPECIES: hypothetical protein [unclassified Arsenophonus]|uniref:hypothetical protein n=1 Tax=unclassified Arsenophonus TaxID=2627083 RepID=UPI002856559C|nr:hypothetical protein [Arsenophonus sp.]MDR5611079.1 hypothetical protein [Arsenophonus sp.]MDR5615021.1 hypothetical protein [Arsenophonus sp.]
MSSSKAVSEQNIESGYIAKNETIRGVFDALSSVINKPIVVSQLAVKKKITGDTFLAIFSALKPKGLVISLG